LIKQICFNKFINNQIGRINQSLGINNNAAKNLIVNFVDIIEKKSHNIIPSSNLPNDIIEIIMERIVSKSADIRRSILPK